MRILSVTFMYRRCLLLSSPQHMSVRFRNPNSTVRTTKRTRVRCYRPDHPTFLQGNDSLSSLFSLISFPFYFPLFSPSNSRMWRVPRQSLPEECSSGVQQQPRLTFSFSFFSSFYSISSQFLSFSKFCSNFFILVIFL